MVEVYTSHDLQRSKISLPNPVEFCRDFAPTYFRGVDHILSQQIFCFWLVTQDSLFFSVQQRCGFSWKIVWLPFFFKWNGKTTEMKRPTNFDSQDLSHSPFAGAGAALRWSLGWSAAAVDLGAYGDGGDLGVDWKNDVFAPMVFGLHQKTGFMLGIVGEKQYGPHMDHMDYNYIKFDLVFLPMINPLDWSSPLVIDTTV